jgi:Tol biopolymer transport system component
VSDVASTVAFSRDGKRMVYERTIQDKGEDQVLIANADGSGETVIFRRESGTIGFSTNPSWSAAGDLIAVGALQLGSKDTLASILVLAPDGRLVSTLPEPMTVNDVAWLPDSSGLFFTGVEKSTGLRPQIWFQPYPEGESFKVSNDLSEYYFLSVAGDGKSFVTTQKHSQATVYVGDSPAILNDKVNWQLTAISSEQASGYSLAWTAAGKLLQRDVWGHSYITAGDGSTQARLLEDTGLSFYPTACGSGDLVVVSRLLESNAANLWRLNVATGALKQLTFGKADFLPSCTPDGRWVVYSGIQPTDKLQHIFKVSIDGGEPVELAKGQVFVPAVSPNGTFVAYGRIDGQGASAKSKFIVQKLEGGAPMQEIESPTTYSWQRQQLAWTPDGRALTYIHHTTGSTTNVYAQPLAGGPPLQLTHFNSEPALVYAYAWSRDGKKFAITRARYNDTDVVMFSGFR